MQKKKVSRFEWVFVQAAAKNGTINIEDYEPYTEEEEQQQREDNINQQIENIVNAHRQGGRNV